MTLADYLPIMFKRKKAHKPVDPLIREMKRQYRASEIYVVDKLLEEQRRWLRKQTIAANKLASVRRRIDAKLKELAAAKVKGQNNE